MNLNYIYALIILECRLSKTQACLLFKKSEEELKETFKPLYGSHPVIYDALKYVLNYETVMPNESREKKALFFAKIYLRRLLNILKNDNVKERKRNLTQFINSLEGPDISSILNKRIINFTNDDRKLLTKFQVKYALSNSAIARKFRTNHEVIVNIGKNTKDENLKHSYLELYEYYAIQGHNFAPLYAKRRKQR